MFVKALTRNGGDAVNHAALEDADLLLRVGDGDERAIEALYERYGRACFALATRILDDRHLAEDVVQQVFLAMWNGSGYDPRRGAVSTWLLSVTHHKAVDAVRKEQRWRDWAETEVPEPSEAVEDRAWASVKADKVRRALEQLPEAQREVLLMAYFGGLTQQEISKRTGVPLGTVKTRTLLGMRRLRAALEPLGINMETDR